MGMKLSSVARVDSWAARTVLVLALCLPSFARPAASQSSELDSLILADMEAVHIPGVAVAAIDSGRIVWTGTYGYADVEREKPVETGTLFMLASVSKPVTATILMQLHAKGLFRLDDDVSGYLPFPVRNPNHPDMPITFRQLLRHRSSIRDNGAYYRPFWSIADGDPTIRLGDYLRGYLAPDGDAYDAAANFFAHAPDEERRYCNTCYALLGYLAEVISGRPFQEYSREAVFGPVCMTGARWFLAEVDTANVAMPYAFADSSGFTPYGHNGYPDWPAGQLRASIEDMARFLATYVEGGMIDGRAALAAGSITTLSPPDMALGFHTWSPRAFPYGDIVYAHGGGDIGVSTFMAFHPTGRRGVVVLSNGEGGVRHIAERLYRAIDDHLDTSSGQPAECP